MADIVGKLNPSAPAFIPPPHKVETETTRQMIYTQEDAAIVAATTYRYPYPANYHPIYHQLPLFNPLLISREVTMLDDLHYSLLHRQEPAGQVIYGLKSYLAEHDHYDPASYAVLQAALKKDVRFFYDPHPQRDCLGHLQSHHSLLAYLHHRLTAAAADEDEDSSSIHINDLRAILYHKLGGEDEYQVDQGKLTLQRWLQLGGLILRDARIQRIDDRGGGASKKKVSAAATSKKTSSSAKAAAAVVSPCTSVDQAEAAIAADVAASGNNSRLNPAAMVFLPPSVSAVSALDNDSSAIVSISPSSSQHHQSSPSSKSMIHIRASLKKNKKAIIQDDEEDNEEEAGYDGSSYDAYYAADHLHEEHHHSEEGYGGSMMIPAQEAQEEDSSSNTTATTYHYPYPANYHPIYHQLPLCNPLLSSREVTMLDDLHYTLQLQQQQPMVIHPLLAYLQEQYSYQPGIAGTAAADNSYAILQQAMKKDARFFYDTDRDLLVAVGQGQEEDSSISYESFIAYISYRLNSLNEEEGIHLNELRTVLAHTVEEATLQRWIQSLLKRTNSSQRGNGLLYVMRDARIILKERWEEVKKQGDRKKKSS